MNNAALPWIVTFAIAAGTTVIVLPLWRRLCLRFELIDEPGHRKIHDAPVALSGGLAILSGLVIAVLVAWFLSLSAWANSNFSRAITEQFPLYAPRLFAAAIGAAAMTGLGLLDDRFELRPLAKFLGQSVIAAGVTLAGIRFPGLESVPAPEFLLTMFWLLTVANAFNFTDNMNGLCAGLGLIAAGFIAALAITNGEPLPALVGVALAGAIAGFLPSNYPKATAFLGDSGSHLLGFILATLVLEPAVWKQTRAHLPAIDRIGPPLLLAVPLLDLCWVTVLRIVNGRPFYIGDNNHLSHQLARRGLPRATAVATLWLLALLCGGLILLLR